MNYNNEIIRSLGRIEGKLDGVCDLADRVRVLEQWQSWLKGGLAALVGGFAYIFKGIYGK